MTWRERLQVQREQAAIFPESPDDLLTKPTKPQAGQNGSLPKLTKPGSVSFVSTPDVHSENIAVSVDAVNATATTTESRTDLLALADRLVVDRVHVHRLDDAEVALLVAMGDGGMRAYLLAADDAATWQAGNVPLDDTAAIHCANCGPVYVHPGIAAVLPVVDGWPRAIGCPWCAIRKAGGHVPRPAHPHHHERNRP